jgi:hypothetical protein
MTEAQLLQQTGSLQVQLANLRAQIDSGRSTAHKDLSLVSLIPNWAGNDKFVGVHDFFLDFRRDSQNRKLRTNGQNTNCDTKTNGSCQSLLQQ